MNRKILLAAALAACGVSAPAMAHDAAAYVRAEAGTSWFDLQLDGFGSSDDKDTSVNLRGGYWFTPNLAVEAFHSRYGEDSEDGARVKFSGTGIGLAAKKNFGQDGNGFYIGGRAGAVQMRAEVGVRGFGSISDKDVVPYVGVGAGYDFTDSFGVGLNYDYVQSEAEFAEDVEIDLETQTLTLDVEYRFVF
jgi:opacity protein-like surface antigen